MLLGLSTLKHFFFINEGQNCAYKKIIDDRHKKCFYRKRNFNKDK